MRLLLTPRMAYPPLVAYARDLQLLQGTSRDGRTIARREPGFFDDAVEERHQRSLCSPKLRALAR